MIGDVFNGRADLALGELTMTAERNQFIDFSLPYLISPLTFVTRNEFVSSKFGLIQLFLTPFWGQALIIIILSCSMLAFLNQKIDKINSFSFFGIFWVTMSGILMRALPIGQFKRNFLKIISIVWHIFGILFWVYYTSFVLSFVLRPGNTIETIEDIAQSVDSGRNQVGFKRHNAFERFLQV